MRYSCQAEAEMAFARFMPFGEIPSIFVVDSEDGESVDAFATSKATAIPVDFDDDYVTYCKAPRRCHCVDCR